MRKARNICILLGRLLTTERRGDRQKSLPTWCVVGRDFCRVHSWIIRQSAAELDEPLINRPFRPANMILAGFWGSFARYLVGTNLFDSLSKGCLGPYLIVF